MICVLETQDLLLNEILTLRGRLEKTTSELEAINRVVHELSQLLAKNGLSY